MSADVFRSDEVALQEAFREEQQTNAAVGALPGEVLDAHEGRLGVTQSFRGLAAADPQAPSEFRLTGSRR